MPAQRTNEPQAAKRSTEGSREGVMSHGKGPETRKRRGPGRPPGSKNKPKGLLPIDLATNLLEVMKGRVAPEHYEYLKGVVSKGEPISTEKELDVLITLVRASAMPYLAIEAMPLTQTDVDGQPVLDDDGNERTFFPGINRDATDRLKLLNSLLALKDGIEKRKDDGDDGDGTPVIVKVYAKRGLDPSRIAVLIGQDPSTQQQEPKRVGPGVVDAG